MSKLNPKHIKDFSLSYTLDTGEVLSGEFTTKRLSILDRSKLGLKKSQLGSGMHCVRDDKGEPTGQGLDESTDMLNNMIAHLEVALIRKPLWWSLDDVADIGLIREVYTKVLEFETSFFRPQGEAATPTGVGQVGSSDKPQEAGLANQPQKVVGQEVQAALDA